jgi:2-oxoglutarate/2-oxoacid ferredoxin oxidoreductase subunit beta
MATVVELPIQSFESVVDPDWCPGCGDFGVLKGLKMAAAKAGIAPKDLVVVSGIGCSSNLPGFIGSYGVHSLHGRAVPVATGVRLANTDLKVVITGGDGDGYGIGIGHFIHAMRRNLNLTYIVMDNQIYGLTTGQASPTTETGQITKSTPHGNVEAPIDPLALAIVSGATYVARAYSGDPNQMADLIAGGLQHNGFALIDTFSPCVTYNKVNTYAFFRKRIYKLEDEKGYDPANVEAAMERAREWGERIPTGLVYKVDKPTYESSDSVLRKGPLTKANMRLDEKVFQSLVEELI